MKHDINTTGCTTSSRTHIKINSAFRKGTNCMMYNHAFLQLSVALLFSPPLLKAQQTGCSGPPSSAQVQTLIASNINAPQGTATITLQTFRVVCLSSSGIRNQYRFVSIVADYFNSNVNNGATLQYGQFEFECDASTSNAWSSTGNLLDAAIFNRVVPLAANSPAINATNRTDCAYCLNSGSLSPPRFTDTVNHCSACSGCAQPLCYITDISLPPSGSNFTSAVCCNFYLSDGTCTTACPPSFSPDVNRTCVAVVTTSPSPSAAVTITPVHVTTRVVTTTVQPTTTLCAASSSRSSLATTSQHLLPKPTPPPVICRKTSKRPHHHTHPTRRTRKGERLPRGSKRIGTLCLPPRTKTDPASRTGLSHAPVPGLSPVPGMGPAHRPGMGLAPGTGPVPHPSN